MVNLRFNFKMDLADISSIDFAFAATYAELETDPFLTKSYPEDGEHSQRSIILTLSAEEAELLPEQFYALATVNFENGETIKAHAFKNTAKEEALSAALALEDTEYNINFFIDEVSGGGGNGAEYTAGNGIDISNENISVKLTNSPYQVLEFSSNGLILNYGYLAGNTSFRNSLTDTRFENALATQASLSNYRQTFSLKYDYDEELEMDVVDLRKNQYPNIKKDDILIDDWYDMDDGNIRIYECYSVSNDQISIKPIKNAVINITNDAPNAIPEQCPYDVGDVLMSDNGNIYRCLTRTQYTTGAYYEYTWQTYNIADKQDTVDANNKLDADYIDDTSSAKILVPAPTSNDIGKVLQVNSNGQPEWVNA